MTAVIMKHIHGRERSLAIGDKHIGRHRVIARQTNLHLARLIAVALLLKEHLCLIAVDWCRGRREHAVKHLLTGCLFPDIKILDVAVSPSQGISQVGNQRVGISRQITHILIPFPLLGSGSKY